MHDRAASITYIRIPLQIYALVSAKNNTGVNSALTAYVVGGDGHGAKIKMTMSGT